jgi:hypothetical protein
MGSDAIAEFLGKARPAALCFESRSGALCAVPVHLRPRLDAEIHVVSADPSLAGSAAQARRSACLVADEFASYEGIQGVILQGELGDTGGEQRGRITMTVRRTIGFLFAGTLPPQLAGPQSGEPLS